MERTSTSLETPYARKETTAKQVSPCATNEWLDKFIQCEFGKCHARDLATPEESYYSMDIQNKIQKLDESSSRDVARKMLLFIANAQSIVMLKGIIQKWKLHSSCYKWKPSQNLTAAKRFEIIQGITEDIAGLKVIRRYHVLDWFHACGRSDIPSSSMFIQTSGENNASKRTGNPLSLAKYDVTLAMMKEMFPALQRGDPRYNKELATVKYYRQLGWKFSILTKEFGRGILALLPYDDLPGEINMRLSDVM